jgi:hypothetical protein
MLLFFKKTINSFREKILILIIKEFFLDGEGSWLARTSTKV